MAEHSIRLWSKHNGSYDVTHHRGGKNESHLYDEPQDFKNLTTLAEAISYMLELGKRIDRNGSTIRIGFETAGYEDERGNWCGAPVSEKQKPKAEIEKAIEAAALASFRCPQCIAKAQHWDFVASSGTEPNLDTWKCGKCSHTFQVEADAPIPLSKSGTDNSTIDAGGITS